MSNMASHHNRIIPYEPGKFILRSFDQENFPLISLNQETFAKYLRINEYTNEVESTQKYLEDIRNHDIFYGKLVLGTCMTEFSVGFFKINNGLFFGIEYIGAYGFFVKKIYPSYVEEKLGVVPIEAAPIADFLNFYLRNDVQIFGDYLADYMR